MRIQPRFQERQTDELAKAREKHPNMPSLHDGYAVILEELDELWAEVKKRPGKRDGDLMVGELVQIAAMAQRMAEDLLAEHV